MRYTRRSKLNTQKTKTPNQINGLKESTVGSQKMNCKWPVNILKKCPKYLPIRATQAMLRFHLSPVRMTTTMKTNAGRVWGKNFYSLVGTSA